MTVGVQLVPVAEDKLGAAHVGALAGAAARGGTSVSVEGAGRKFAGLHHAQFGEPGQDGRYVLIKRGRLRLPVEVLPAMPHRAVPLVYECVS